MSAVSFVRSFYFTQEWILGTIHVTYFEIALWEIYGVSWQIPRMSWFDSLKRELDYKSLKAKTKTKTKQKQAKAKKKTETELDYFIDYLLKYKQHDE